MTCCHVRLRIMVGCVLWTAIVLSSDCMRLSRRAVRVVSGARMASVGPCCLPLLGRGAPFVAGRQFALLHTSAGLDTMVFNCSAQQLPCLVAMTTLDGLVEGLGGVTGAAAETALGWSADLGSSPPLR